MNEFAEDLASESEGHKLRPRCRLWFTQPNKVEMTVQEIRRSIASNASPRFAVNLAMPLPLAARLPQPT